MMKTIMRRSITVLMTAAACAVWAAVPASAATTWAIQATPNPGSATGPALLGVSCPSANSCFAVGTDTNSNPSDQATQMLAEHWNGSTWAIQATPSPSGSLDADLTAVACPSTTSCIAVGENTTSANGVVDVDGGVAEHWNGSTWKLQTMPSPSGALNADIRGVSCTSVTSCTAVGDVENSGGVEQPLAEHWNGSTWAIQATPVPSGAEESGLNAVSCTSVSNCIAVGSLSGTASYIAVMAEHWNGRTWTVQDVINPNGASPSSDTADELDGVSCTSATSCIAVGFNNVGDQGLAEHWNGSSWKIQSTPSGTNGNGPEFDAVSCVSATACTAVGGNGSGTSTLAEQWNGSSWTFQSTPNVTGAADNVLEAISCLSTSACTAVGNTDNTTLAERS
jgi:hypothetical protein